MKKPGWRLGTVGGSPVYLAPSWLIVAAILTFLFLPTVQAAAPGLGTVASVAAATTFPVLLFASVLAHELAHGAVARAVGASVREYVLTFWGGHTSFGSELRTPGASALVSAAGPAANLVLAGIGWWLAPQLTTGLAAVVVLSLTWSNLVVAFFNLLPGNPLDGGRILEALIWRVTGDRETGTIGAGWVGRVLAVGVGVALVVLAFARPGQVSLTLVVWGVIVAGLVWNGATQSIRLGRARRSSAGFDVRGLLTPVLVASSGSTLADLPPRPFGVGALDVVVVDAAGTPVGVVDAAAAAGVPAHERIRVSVDAVARRLAPEAVIDQQRGADALAALAAAYATGPTAVLVSASGVLGTISREAVLAALDPSGSRGSAH